uniref:DNA-damage inducible transcript 3 n=1 Tax=Peromyscus maniculatus bairdii TaxID=230844 RepID=A0A8C8W2H8_PERMB
VLKMNGWQRQSQNKSRNLRRECSRRKCIFIHHHT